MSLRMTIAATLLRLRPKLLVSADRTALAVQQERVDVLPPASLSRTHRVTIDEIDGMRTVTLEPLGAQPVRELFYAHGGAYLNAIVGPHWDIIRDLASGTPVRVTVPLYPLAPEHTASEVLPRIFAAYDRVGATGLPVVVAGDSAGAGIAMALALRARDEGLTPPAAAVLFSPWVDATMSNPDIAAIEPRDPMLASAGLVWAAERWAGEWPITDPRISPLRDSLADLPRLAVFQGGRDIFAPDARLFVEKAQAAGTRAELHVYDDAFHVFVGVPALPESRDALARARAVIGEAVHPII